MWFPSDLKAGKAGIFRRASRWVRRGKDILLGAMSDLLKGREVNPCPTGHDAAFNRRALRIPVAR